MKTCARKCRSSLPSSRHRPKEGRSHGYAHVDSSLAPAESIAQADRDLDLIASSLFSKDPLGDMMELAWFKQKGDGECPAVWVSIDPFPYNINPVCYLVFGGNRGRRPGTTRMVTEPGSLGRTHFHYQGIPKVDDISLALVASR